MPRNEIKIADKVEYLSILSENGKLDTNLEPDIPEETLLKLHRTMLLGRKFDERLLNLQRQGRIGTFPPISGQEAAHLGTAAALDLDDPGFAAQGADPYIVTMDRKGGLGHARRRFCRGSAGHQQGAHQKDCYDQ